MPPERGGPGFDSPIARACPWILGFAMLLAAAFALYEGRGTSFTPDEWLWLIASPGMGVDTAFMTSTGHLQLVPRVLYKVLLEIFGTEYVWFRLLTVASLLLMVGLLYRWLSERVGAMVALVPSILLLFFGADAVHLIRGNGFTILFSIACGIAALAAAERRDRGGDVAACLLLILGLATYTNAMPFLVGVGVGVVLRRDWRRLWVPAVPLALYGVWRLWLTTAGPQGWGGDLYLENLLRVPEWIFNALASILSAMTGLGYGFTRISDSGPDDLIGPLLAAIALAAFVWRMARGNVGRPVWVILAVGISLWTMQCLASDPNQPDLRAADETRYLYPGAVVVTMIAAELVAGWRWKAVAYYCLVAVCLFGLASNIKQTVTYGDLYRDDSTRYRVAFTAATTALEEQSGGPVPELSEPVLTPTFEELNDAMARRPYGGLGYTKGELEDLSAADREQMDRDLRSAADLGLAAAPAGGRTRRCHPIPVVGETAGVELEAGMVLIVSRNPRAEILLGRYGDQPTVSLGRVPDGKAVLTTDAIRDGVPYRVAATGAGAKVCGP